MKSYGHIMPSKKQYNLVPSDDYDSREPLHPEEAFQHGILFQAKYIGTLDVDKPRSRVEIVSAMRRIRYEFKARGIKKRKVQIIISAEGVKISLKKKKKKNQVPDDDLMVMTHPVYRIFYVSHDSQDLKIFSYIARDGSSNLFRCHVFKSYKKSQAIRIVRTVGQAFEVCHKLSLSTNPSNTTEPSGQQSSDGDGSSNKSSEDHSDKIIKDPHNGDYVREPALAPDVGDLIPDLNQQEEFVTPAKLVQAEPACNTSENMASVLGNDTYIPSNNDTCEVPVLSPNTPLSAYHEIQLMKEQLDQQQQQTQIAVAQVRLLRDQLATESAARLEAQSRTHQLLVHNKELLEHIQNLVRHIQELERGKIGNISPSLGGRRQDIGLTPQVNIICDSHTPASSNLRMTDLQEQQLLTSLGSNFYDSCQMGVPSSPHSQLGGIKSSIFQFPQDLQSGRRPYSLIPPQSGVRRYAPGETSSGSSESDVQRLESRNASSELIDASHIIRQQLDALSLDPHRHASGVITRSSSEKVPNSRREEMISQIQRAGWARHTTS